MAGLPRSLSRGLVPLTKTILYAAPANTYVQTSMIEFSNGDSDVVLNVYKQTQNQLSRISPNNFIFYANYLAQEDGVITLSPGDCIVAECSVAGVVNYSINGFTETLTK